MAHQKSRRLSQRRLRGSHHWRAARLALLLAILSLHAAAPVRGQQCDRYVPGDCLFSTYDDRPAVFPRPLHAASFSLEAEVTCPFHGAGTFVIKPTEQCDDPFMSARKRRLPGTRARAHCSSGSLAGEFKRQGKRFYYEPHAEHHCSYFEYTRAEVCTASERWKSFATNCSDCDTTLRQTKHRVLKCFA